jgi:diacylglycerol kinase (ATP)
VEPPSHSLPATPDLLLVNPAAGGGRAAAILPALREFANHRGWQLEICVTSDQNDLASKARDAADTGRKRIFVLGGDGTFQVLLNAVANFPEIVLGVIPAGGGNDLAASLGLPRDPLQAAALLLDGKPCPMDVVRIRTADGRERLYTGGGGVGLDAEAALHANGAYRNLPGRPRYLLAAIRVLFGFRPAHVRITIEGIEPQCLEAKALLVAVLNTPSYGGGLHLAPNAKTDDGKLDLVVLDDLSMPRILLLLPALASRGELKTTRLRRFSVTHVRIETDTPRWFHGDGELLGMTPVDISVVPRAIRVMRPKQSQRP